MAVPRCDEEAIGTADAQARAVKRHTRKSRRAKREALKQQALDRAERRREGREQTLEREARIQATLREPYDPVARFLRANPHCHELAHSIPNFEKLCCVVRQKASRLFDEHYIAAFMQMARLGWHRPLEDWVPLGKGKERIFRSLARHLFAEYPTPDVIWSVFFHPDAEKLRFLAGHVGAGGSLFQLVKKGRLPITLTKKQCHRVLASPASPDFLQSVRAAQFADLGTDRHLFAAWVSSDIGSRVNAPKTEVFFLSFVHLCAKAPLFNPDMFEPLLDYLHHRRRENIEFSLKGRTLQSLLRGMEEWHAELHHRQTLLATGEVVFPPSDFQGAIYPITVQRKGTLPLRKRWRIREILTAKELFLEGKKQRHCVASYGRGILEGKHSIWSLTLNEGAGPERALTIQLQNNQKVIVQIRGFANRRATKTERQIVQRWATENGLSLGSTA